MSEQKQPDPTPHPEPPFPFFSMSSTPTIPSDVQLSYLAEGAANIVYRVSFFPRSRTPLPTSVDPANPASNTPPPTELDVPGDDDYDPNCDPLYDNVLLRLRKALPSSQPNVAAHQYLSETVLPLFPPDMPLQQTPVRLPPSLVPQANAALRRLEAGGSRPEKRRGLYLAGDETAADRESVLEDIGFLVTDMTPERLNGELLIEFKAKWLVQSPSAPENWTRCRTCALRLSKSDKSGVWEGLCPMDLASADKKRLRRAAEWIVKGSDGIMEDVHGDDLEKLIQRVSDFLISEKGGQRILGTLKELQGKLDKDGPLKADVGSPQFLTAMTVRDCTVFLRVTPSSIEARIGDLDKKSPAEGKGEYWKGVETTLTEGGWYTSEEKGDYPWKQAGREINCR